MDHEQARRWLDVEWSRILDEAPSEPDPEVDALVDSKVGSIRYAVVTQILGKIADPGRSLLALQLGAPGKGAWDARSFATAVIVPWERDNQQVIGKSPDPYVSNPLRRPRLDDDTSVRDKGAWASLVAFLLELDGLPAGDLQHAFRRVLRALERRQARQQFSCPVPSRISQARLETLVTELLEQPSGGLRPMVVATALFRTLGEGFGLFAVVRSQGVNEADAASGVPGDIVCSDRDENLRLVVEVKDTKLTLAHLQEARLKSKRSDDPVSNFPRRPAFGRRTPEKSPG